MLLFIQLFIVALIWVLDVAIGFQNHFFTILWWWDIPMHFLGGLWAGFFGVWLLHNSKKFTLRQKSIGIAIAIGICWEIFEYSFGIAGSVFMPYPVDTAKDLLMDTIGGYSAGVIAQRFKL
jgi:hypothetical protein